jgi:tRNA-splicing ligase RtcB (3'-phosphate/5'-hydroxy nucleic acid ligase)
MNVSELIQKSDTEWWIEPTGSMRVPGILYASEPLIREMDDKVAEQVRNVASLPGIVGASYAMPDAHWGYGFPIGGVAAFDPDVDGVVSAGGVGFDISCGVRTLVTGLREERIEPVKSKLAEELFRRVPAGMGQRGRLHLDDEQLDAMLTGGARWAVSQGYGRPNDLERIEDDGRAAEAVPAQVSQKARDRQRNQMGTLGSGNHYLEVQRVADILTPDVADAFGLREGEVVVSIHCGSRGLGHQIGTDYLGRMVGRLADFHVSIPDRELACAPIRSDLGEAYLGAMRAGINCALANRQVLTHLVREAFAALFPEATLEVLYDVSHNTCKVEEHVVDRQRKRLFVHRKGATRALGPGDRDLPERFRPFGQPVLIGGTMGTASYVLVGTPEGSTRAFGSSCHGAGRRLSRHAAVKQFPGRQVIDDLARRGILVRSRSTRGVAEEAPGAYKDVSAVVEAAERAGLSRGVARLEPVICVKG